MKSNIGHLKAAAGAAGMFKMVRSLHEKVLAPSLNFRDPNPNVDWDRSPFRVNTELREWPAPPCGVRRGGVSAFGFGGTNFHVVLEEHVPGLHRPARRVHASAQIGAAHRASPSRLRLPTWRKAPLRGALVLGGRDDADIVAQLNLALAEARAGRVPAPVRPDPAVGAAAVRVAVDFADAADLATKIRQAGEGLRRWQPRRVPHAAPAGSVRRPRPGAEGGVPLHRTGLAVREHAAGTARRASRSWPRPSSGPMR